MNYYKVTYYSSNPESEHETGEMIVKAFNFNEAATITFDEREQYNYTRVIKVEVFETRIVG